MYTVTYGYNQIFAEHVCSGMISNMISRSKKKLMFSYTENMSWNLEIKSDMKDSSGVHTIIGSTSTTMLDSVIE